MERKEYPIFSGKVHAVPGIVELKGEYYTTIQYISPKDELTERDIKENMPLGLLSVMIEKDRDKMEKILRERIKIAVVPLRVDPSVILGADIRTRFGELTDAEYGDGNSMETYELEIIKGKSGGGGDMFAGLAEIYDRTPHTGMRYIKILE